MIDEVAMELSDQIDELYQTLLADNNQRFEDLLVFMSELVDPYVVLVQEQIDNVDEWFGDRLEWIEELYDEVYKQNLKNQLEMIRDSSIDNLNLLLDNAISLREEASITLATNMNNVA